MIATIHGTVLAAKHGEVVVVLGGLGLRILVPDSVLEHAHVGRSVDLFTHLYVRETELALYGFGSQSELDLFVMLLGVSGIGPLQGRCGRPDTHSGNRSQDGRAYGAGPQGQAG
jgi:Holliday junction DNA helicase RuvA